MRRRPVFDARTPVRHGAFNLWSSSPLSVPAVDAAHSLVAREADRSPVRRSTEVDAFFARLRRAQVHFVDSVGEAGMLLHGAPCELAALAALHGRLTQEFLDAQHSLLRRRADVGAVISRITRDADTEAQALVAAAQDRATGRSVHALPGGSQVDPDVDHLLSTYDARLAHPARGATFVATGPGVEVEVCHADRDLATTVAAFAPLGDDMRMQLRELLDGWWGVETRAGQAAIEDADAAASLQRRVASIEAGEILEEARADRPALPPPSVRAIALPAATPFPPPPPVPPVSERPPAPVRGPRPEQVIAALDAADGGDLDSLLHSLLELAPMPAPRTEADHREPEIPPAEAEPVAEPAVAAPAVETAFPLAVVQVPVPAVPAVGDDRFWDPPAPERRGPTVKWFVFQVVLPMAAVLAVIVLGFAAAGALLGSTVWVGPLAGRAGRDSIRQLLASDNGYHPHVAPSNGFAPPAVSSPNGAAPAVTGGDVLAAEMSRLQAEITAARERLEAMKRRADERDAQAREASGIELARVREALAAMEQHHQSALAAVRAEAESQAAQIVAEASRPTSGDAASGSVPTDGR